MRLFAFGCAVGEAVGETVSRVLEPNPVDRAALDELDGLDELDELRRLPLVRKVVRFLTAGGGLLCFC